MASIEKLALLLWQLLTNNVLMVNGNVCFLQQNFTCTVQDAELPDKTIDQTCICSSADCIPSTNPCPTVKNIKFKDPSFEFLSKNSFINYNEIRSIDIESNSLRYIEATAFGNCRGLKMLRIIGSEVQVQTGGFNQLERLENLQFQPNFVSLSSDVFAEIGSTLKYLDLGSGIVRSIENDTFDRFVNLTVLSIANNKLRMIKKECFARLINLQELNLGGNNIESIPSSVFSSQQNLERLYLPENNIMDLEHGCFDGLGSLDELVLSGNRIKSLNNLFDGLTNLTKLIINDNSLHVITDTLLGLKSLKKLSLSGNSINRIAMGTLSFPNLEFLDLSRNALTSILGYYFQELKKISRINLGYNKINQISDGALNGLTNLRYLYLENNQLTTFSFYSLGNNNILQQLYLQNNSLTSISFSTILQPPPLMYLEILWLHNNRLPTFPSLIFDYAPMLAINRNSLKLTNNAFTCDCNIKGLTESRRNIILDSQIRTQCTEPICSAPTTVFAQDDLTLPDGDEVSIICKVSGQPHPLVSWTYNNRHVIGGWYSIITGTSQIHFNKLTIGNYGNYTCTGANSVGSSSVTINLYEEKPKHKNSNAKDDHDSNGANNLQQFSVAFYNFIVFAILKYLSFIVII